MGVCSTFDKAESGRGFLWTPGRSGEPSLTKEPDPTRTRNEGTKTKTKQQSRYRHSGRERRSAEGGPRGQQDDCRIQDLSWRAAWLPRGLPCELSQGSRGRRLEPDASVVQEVQRARLLCPRCRLAILAGRNAHQR